MLAATPSVLRYEGLEPLEPHDPRDLFQQREAECNRRIFGLLGELWRRVHGVLDEFRVEARATPVYTHHTRRTPYNNREAHSYRFEADLRCPLFTARLHFEYTREITGIDADVYRESLQYRLDQMTMALGATLPPVDHFNLFANLTHTQGAGVPPVVADMVTHMRPVLMENRHRMIRPVFAPRARSVFSQLPSVPRDHVAHFFRESLDRDVERWLVDGVQPHAE